VSGTPGQTLTPLDAAGQAAVLSMSCERDLIEESAVAGKLGLAHLPLDGEGQPSAGGAPHATPVVPGLAKAVSGHAPRPSGQLLAQWSPGTSPAEISSPDTSALAAAAKPDARQSGELRSSIAEVSTESAGRGARTAPNASASSGEPRPADSEVARSAGEQLAFTARLAPAAGGEQPPVQLPAYESPLGLGDRELGSIGGSSTACAKLSAVADATAVSPTGAAGGDSRDTPGAGSSGAFDSDAQSHRGAGAAALDRFHEPAGSAGQADAASPSPAEASPGEQRAGSAGSAPSQPATVRLTSATEPAAPPKLASDITLQLDSGSQRVAVRLVERGGEVHVAVRTTDAGLAENLRQSLPSLAGKLEQNGFRTETWHPGTAPRHPAESAAGGSPQDRGSQDGQESSRQRRDGHAQDREAAQQPQQKKEGKDFAWFMSSLG